MTNQMTAPPSFVIEVNRVSLRCALTAVLPHVGNTNALCRVRIMISDEKTMIILASSGTTGIAARAHISRVLIADEFPTIDLEPRSAREILSVFQPPRGKDERSAWEMAAFEIQVTEQEVTISEPAGLFEDDDLDRSLTVPRVPPPAENDSASRFPDLARILLNEINVPHQERRTQSARVAVDQLEAFAKSAKAYGITQLMLRFFESRHGTLVHIADDAVGMTGGSNRDRAHDLEVQEDSADVWEQRLSPLKQELVIADD